MNQCRIGASFIGIIALVLGKPKFFLRDAMLARYMLWSCVFVCVWICPSHSSNVSKWLNLVSCKQRRTIALGLKVSAAKDLRKIRTGCQVQVGRLKLATRDK